MANYLTLKEAADATGKSERQLRRICNDPNNKDYISHNEKGRLLVDANFLTQNYPLVNVPKTTGKTMPFYPEAGHVSENQFPDNLAFKVALLEQELRHKGEITDALLAEKDKRIEVLERSLLILGESREVVTEPVVPEPVKRKKVFGLF
ncbi:MAG: hypothetical protein EOP42_32245 [Sphingobacteriaceae bacterium]|nr:MAG: hypothetical protein EOP42_32245 [Sphingobacteriaceae bacterium]